MGNNARGTTTVKFRGDNLNLVLDINAMCELEDKTGLSIQKFLEGLEDESNVKIKDLRLIAWAMMLGQLPGSTEHDAGELLRDMGPEFGDIITEAIQRSFPEASKEPTTVKKK